ncbi:MAG TPA: hypothetical protein VEY07_06265 [Thermoplasmata archaeon]|nr:hypothetical protein [Thermoplasmata archaeon]
MGRPGRLDVYLFPAVVGGGLGDVAEVLDAGRWLDRAGFRCRLYRSGGRALPPSVDGPWDWPAIDVVDALRPEAPRALTVSPTWGVSAAPARPEPFGRGGPWATETAEIESVYGVDQTLHVSLEEFARTYSSRRENEERFREGGVPTAELARRARSRDGRRAHRVWVEAFRRYRSLDVRNVLHLMGTFEADATFAREFPEIVQMGPLWPGAYAGGGSGKLDDPPTVLWYASPSSSSRLLPEVARGVARTGRPAQLLVRSPRPLPASGVSSVSYELLSPVPTRLWRPRFRTSALRIVTGSRTLLEALELGGPFLYFNGVLRSRNRNRRHRPEKIVALLRLFRRLGVERRILADLDAFSRGHRVAQVVDRALTDRRWRAGFPTPAEVRRAVPEGIGEVLTRVARRFAGGALSSSEIVQQARSDFAGGTVRGRSKV